MPNEIPDAPRAGGETPMMRATNYALAFDLLKVAGWVAAHTLPGEKADVQFAIVQRAVSHLRGESREPVQRLDELLRNDPWAAAIASHVQASLLERHVEAQPDPSKLESRVDLHRTATQPEKEGLAAGSGTPLDVEACVRLLDDLIRMLSPHDAQSIAYANLLRALRAALPGMAELRAAATHYIAIHNRHDSVYIRENGRHGHSPWAELVDAARAAQPEETSADASQDCYACGHDRAQHLNESDELDDCLDCHCSEFMQSPAPSPERPE